jgi:hypothetical protein
MAAAASQPSEEAYKGTRTAQDLPHLRPLVGRYIRKYFHGYGHFVVRMRLTKDCFKPHFPVLWLVFCRPTLVQSHKNCIYLILYCHVEFMLANRARSPRWMRRDSWSM